MLAAYLSGCTSLTVTAPAASSTVSMPQEIKVTESVGLDGYTHGQKILVDGVDPEHSNNVNYSVPWNSTLCCLNPGAHSVSVSGQTSSRTVSATSNFTVAANACPDCYACPNGSVHPVFGVCCDGGSCDIPASSNFGPWRFPTTSCPTAQVRSNDCLNQNANGICGANGTGCAALAPMATQMLAVSFSLGQAGTLKQIQVPIGWRNGTNSFQLWIANDAGGKPGTIIEAFAARPIRTQPFPVRSPEHIFSVAHPNLAAGTTYWLVIGPTAQDAVGSWNYSLDDAPAVGSTNFLVNTSPNANGVPQLAGPWVPATGSVLRPAFEIDIR
ncbi:MAG TPA: choice-of-anchor R domain-containing protein [Spongiibacteraceae bacterium]